MRWAITSLITAFALAACTAAGVASSETTPSAVAATSMEADTVLVQRRDFLVRYVLDATTKDSGSVRVNLARGLEWQNVTGASTVNAGDVIGSAAISARARAELEEAEQGGRIAAAQLRRLDGAAGDVKAPASGALTVDDAGASVATVGVDVVVVVSGIQHLRLSSLEITGVASVETVVGRRDVPCDALWLEAAIPGDDAGATVHCRLPVTTETVAGLRATLSLESETIADAQVVPDRMLGTDADGYTLMIDQGEGPTVLAVDVGAGDGVVRVILTPLPAGATVVAPAAP